MLCKKRQVELFESADGHKGVFHKSDDRTLSTIRIYGQQARYNICKYIDFSGQSSFDRQCKLRELFKLLALSSSTSWKMHVQIQQTAKHHCFCYHSVYPLLRIHI